MSAASTPSRRRAFQARYAFALVQAITAEGVLRVVAYLHIGVGIVFTAGFVGHFWGVKNGNRNGNGHRR